MADPFSRPIVIACEIAARPSNIHRKWLRDRPQDYGAPVRRRIEFGQYQPATRYIEALSLRAGIVRQYCETAFADCDVLLTPTAPVTAPFLAEVDVGDSKEMPELVLLLSPSPAPAPSVIWDCRRSAYRGALSPDYRSGFS